MSKRISKKKLAANRKNAQKSTGPKTPEGKARAARNAIKHGLLAQTVVVHAAHESQTDFDQLLEDLRQDLQPAGPLQETLTERIATCYWRLCRAQRYESGCIEQNFANLFDPASDTTSPPDYLADIANLPEEDDLKNLIRYESMIDRQLHRSLHELRQQQKHQQRRSTFNSQLSPLSEPKARRHAHATRNTKHSPSRIPQEVDTHTSAGVGMLDTPTTQNPLQVQLPERLSTGACPPGRDLGNSTLDLGPVGGYAADQTNPNLLKNDNNPLAARDLHAPEMTTSNTPTDQKDDQSVYLYPNQDDSTGAATEKRRKIQTA